MNESLLEGYRRQLSGWADENRLRKLNTAGPRDGARIVRGDRPVLNLSSNDYLGLAVDDQRLAAFYAAQTDANRSTLYGSGSSASRLMTGSTPLTHELEALIGERYGRAALVFNSGYHANLGILPAITDRHDLVVADRLCHASLIDGLTLGRATFKRFRHLDYDHCRAILAAEREQYRRVFIVTESIFSMDGDVADLRELVKIKEAFDAGLYVDEAHAVGVRGDTGLGLCEEQHVIDAVDLIVGTFGKALASVGAYVAADPILIEYLVNSMRPFIFTTALPPVVLNWNLGVFQDLPDFAGARTHLHGLAAGLRQALHERGLETRGSSQIVPVIVGQNERAVALGERLLAQGYLALPVRPPTVPVGEARIRLSLSANMQPQDLAGLPELLGRDT
jgi:8-amino-7-oxononanoate synthase